jgi:NitT/TauT family transport system substrate-binding protein
MKKLIAVLLLLSSLFLLASCGDTDDDSIRVGYLMGTTGVGLAKMIADVESIDGKDVTFTMYSSPQEIQADLANGSLDFGALPTNAFPNFYKQTNSAVQLAAINTLGVLYLVTDGIEIESLADLSGKTVYVPEAAPKLVLQYLLNAAGVQNVTLSMEYDLKNNPLSSTIAIGDDTDVKIALLPEPQVTVALKTATQNGRTLDIALNLSEVWESYSETSLVQGCMVVSRSFAEKNASTVDNFLALYEQSVSFMADPTNLSEAAGYAVEAGILPNVAVATAAIPRCNLTFRRGSEMKTDAIGFFEALKIAAPAGTPYYGAD